MGVPKKMKFKIKSCTQLNAWYSGMVGAVVDAEPCTLRYYRLVGHREKKIMICDLAFLPESKPGEISEP